MEFFKTSIDIRTRGKGLYEFTEDVVDFLMQMNARAGHLICTCQHTTASIALLGGVDDEMKRDLVAFFRRLAPEDGSYSHNNTGLDDMPSHLKAALTLPAVALSVSGGDLMLGLNQGLFLFEHREGAQTREISVSFVGLVEQD